MNLPDSIRKSHWQKYYEGYSYKPLNDFYFNTIFLLKSNKLPTDHGVLLK